jgi:hypothetical protein
MKRFWLARALKFAVILVVALGVVSVIVMYLWNWLVPTLFSGPAITYWQTLGLLLLSRLLLGGFRPRGPFGHGRHPGHFGHGRFRHGPFGRRMHGMNWSHMTREERKRMREHLRNQRRGFGGSPPAHEPQGPETDV